MIGRYISEENYYKLGLEQNEEFNRHASKTLLVILEEDLDAEGDIYSFTLEQRQAFAKDVCQHNDHMLNGIVEYAQNYATVTEPDYED